MIYDAILLYLLFTKSYTLRCFYYCCIVGFPFIVPNSNHVLDASTIPGDNFLYLTVLVYTKMLYQTVKKIGRYIV